MLANVRKNLRLLLTLTAAWAILLGSAHALHAGEHDAGAAGSFASEHACVLCALDRHTPLPEPVADSSALVPAPSFDPFSAEGPAVSARHAFPHRAPAACAGRAPPSVSVF